MTKPEFLRIVDRMGRLWPHSGLCDANRVDWDTLDVWLQLWAPLAADDVLAAVDSLARDGETFYPPPGVVLRRATEIAASNILALPDPELTRPATAEERAQASRRLPELRAAIARLSGGMALEGGQ